MSISSKTYLDYAASTPVDARVVDVMLPYFTQFFGNSSSIHIFGQKSDAAIENARILVSELLNCKPSEIIFTSGGTESDNLAIRGAAIAARESRKANHILISPVEHHAVSETAKQLATTLGFELEYLPINRYGLIDPADVSAKLRPETAVVSVIHANNEIGTINPVSEIGAICRERGILFHTDSVQAAAHMPLDLSNLNVDMMSIGAHKFYGPKGIGALYIREGTSLLPTQTGGNQELGMRAGTPNTPYIVGLAEALRLTHEEFLPYENEIRDKRDHLIGHILEEIPDSKLTGHPENRLSNLASFVFKGVDGNMLLQFLDIAGFACSSGSACKTGEPEPSNILIALGHSKEWAFGSLRVSISHLTTPKEINSFLKILPKSIATARNGSTYS